jgi:chromosome segregation protein
MRLKHLELNGFKSFSKKTSLEFLNPVVCIVGPNGSGKSNVVESFRFVLGEQSMKSMRGRAGVDLIFKGSKNLPKGTRASATIYFDNSDKIFKLSNEEGEKVDLNYDTVSIERVVYADGLNKYILNGTEVRLKDINNLLASVNIGASGHHIISQGEADRILNASSKDKREMIEDALGLKIYQYKIKESERKLEKTTANMKEVALLRRENAPHIRFLKGQVEKFEKVKELKLELGILYREYLKKENIYLENEKTKLVSEKHRLTALINDLNAKIGDGANDDERIENKKLEELKIVEEKISNIRRIKGELERKLGRIEGMIEMEEARKIDEPEEMVLSQVELKGIVSELNDSIDTALHIEDLTEVRSILERIKNILNKFSPSNQENLNREILDKKREAIENLKNTQNQVSLEMNNLQTEEDKFLETIRSLKEEIQTEIEKDRDKEREKFTLRVEHQELSSQLRLNKLKEENLAREVESFENEVKEGIVLIGEREVLAYQAFVIEDFSPEWDRNTQEELRRKIERIKIKLEDSALGNGAEILKEYKEVTERDQFLMKEMEDLAVSITTLEQLIIDLKEKIDLEFKNGVKKINVEFQEFFSLMFGGGSGELNVIVESKKKRGEPADAGSYGEAKEDVEEIEFQQGIEINVSLPHKKVKELQSLSGGERSLTSIALLFAMSQVNPPPFLILDETDAALDEANSRKYGDMIERLSKHSQLIVVTHNRETMSRAGILYGVTIGSDGASKLLSVKFEEAVAVSK